MPSFFYFLLQNEENSGQQLFPPVDLLQRTQLFATVDLLVSGNGGSLCYHCLDVEVVLDVCCGSFVFLLSQNNLLQTNC